MIDQARTDAIKSIVAGATGAGVPAGGYVFGWTPDDLLFWLAVLNGVGALAFLIYQWWWKRRMYRAWEAANAKSSRAPPVTDSVELDE